MSSVVFSMTWFSFLDVESCLICLVRWFMGSGSDSTAMERVLADLSLEEGEEEGW